MSDTQVPDLVLVEDYDAAVRLLSILANQGTSPRPGAHPVGKQWLLRACEHLYQQLDGSFRDGPKVTTEQQAMAVLKGMGQELSTAAQSLRAAAEALKNAGKIMPAQAAMLAGKRAAKAAQGVGA